MVSRIAHEPPAIRQDGFGSRLVADVPPLGRVERLMLSPHLSTPASEQAIRARAAHLSGLAPAPIARVLRVERTGALLSMLTEVLDGVALAEILAALEFGTLTLSDDEIVELAISVVRAAGRLHESLGSIAHGALSPMHVVVMRDGSTMFTGAVFGDALQSLKLSRDQMWREFGLALPAAAGLPRLDQRTDVTQLAALVLAIGQRRTLRRDEFPARVGELVTGTMLVPTPKINARFQTWLQDALQLHGRVVFDSCAEAAARFTRILPKGCGDETGALALRTAILQLSSSFPTSLLA
jgi:hypothetical protein